MPSPVGHTLIGLAIAGAALLPRIPARRLPAEALYRSGRFAGCILLANAPDLDYLPGIVSGDFNAYHHNYTHSIGWCFLLAVGVWAGLRALGRRGGAGTFLLIFGLLMSHLLADWLTADGRAPFGIMLAWPFSDAFMISPISVFPSLMKNNYSEFLCMHNAMVILVEALWCVPLLLAVAGFKSLAPRRKAQT